MQDASAAPTLAWCRAACCLRSWGGPQHAVAFENDIQGVSCAILRGPFLLCLGGLQPSSREAQLWLCAYGTFLWSQIQKPLGMIVCKAKAALTLHGLSAYCDGKCRGGDGSADPQHLQCWHSTFLFRCSVQCSINMVQGLLRRICFPFSASACFCITSYSHIPVHSACPADITFLYLCLCDLLGIAGYCSTSGS